MRQTSSAATAATAQPGQLAALSLDLRAAYDGRTARRSADQLAHGRRPSTSWFDRGGILNGVLTLPWPQGVGEVATVDRPVGPKPVQLSPWVGQLVLVSAS